MAGFDGTIITLVDDEGFEREFEQIDTLELDGVSYAALVPTYDSPEELIDSDGELVILKMIPEESGENVYVTIDDDAEFDKIAQIFEKRFDENDEFELLH